MSNYEDIINMKHFDPKHKRMSMHERAAQFAPFSALVGYSDQINETGRITENESFIDEDYKDIINRKLKLIKEHLDERPKVSVKYFVPDNNKSGGKYEEYKGNLEKIDMLRKKLIFSNKKEVYINHIKNIEFDISTM